MKKTRKARVIWCGQDAAGNMWQLFEYYRREICRKGLKPVKFVEVLGKTKKKG